jgi:hypothetical protein
MDLDPWGADDALSPEKSEHGGHGVDVAQRGDVAKQTLSVGEQRRRQDGQRGVFGPAHLDRARKPLSPANANGVHGSDLRLYLARR